MDVTAGSGNVFADLGFSEPEVHLAKAKIAAQIAQAIRAQELTQKQAADLLGLDQPKVSALVRGKLSGFTLERLLRLLTELGYDVEITTRQVEGKGHIGVAA